MDPRDLYGLPLERFTEERNGLVRQLRRDGDRDQAGKVAKLRKPSVSAWVVNQLVRSQRREIEALFKAGDALQKAQADLLRKRGDARPLRQAVSAERKAVDQLTSKAQGLLGSEGHELTAARLEDVAQTLHAAALDGDARALVRDGCLERELRHIGLGALEASSASGSKVSKSQTRDARERAVGHAAELRAARKLEAEARRRAERAARQADAAQGRRDQASKVLRDAEESLASAREVAEHADRDLREAERVVRSLSS